MYPSDKTKSYKDQGGGSISRLRTFIDILTFFGKMWGCYHGKQVQPYDAVLFLEYLAFSFMCTLQITPKFMKIKVGEHISTLKLLLIFLHFLVKFCDFDILLP